MTKLISVIVAFSVFSSACFADCDFTQGAGVNKLPDGNYEYSKECHVAVGQLVQDNTTKTQQVNDLNKAIELKDLAITKADERAQNWMDTSLKLEDNIQKIDSVKKQNEWIYFGLGVLSVFAAGVATASLTNRH